MTESADYKATILLPKTSFPMKANLAQREPTMLARWSEERIYERMLEARKDAPRYAFHDGPPYANGNIHYGHIFNKTLKDFVTKYHLLKGEQVRFVPGWDCHGLPIELNVERALGKAKKAALSKVQVRQLCAKEAEKWSGVQSAEFQRLGCFGTWEQPYWTMHPRYERGIVEALGAFVEQDLLYRGKKPVYWCASCRTALAEAEVEYADHVSPSVYVRFALDAASAIRARAAFGVVGEQAISAVIWTTTPWTLPANLATAVGPALTYGLFQPTGREELWLLATERSEAVAKATRVELTQVGQPVLGEALVGLVPRHPFEDRASPIFAGDHVTLEAGTGLVHTAPGHGMEDYILGQAHGLEPFAPVDEAGCYTDEVRPAWRGKFVFDANPDVVALLAESGALCNAVGDKVGHSYAHCWRCKKPVLYRATTQWFIAMDKPSKTTGKTLREVALAEIDRIHGAGGEASGWIPAWGRDRIHGMLRDRPDWCISRQRAWGVPIAALHCASCEKVHIDAAIVAQVARVIGERGADVWFEGDAGPLTPPGYRCDCGSDRFNLDGNILDVWFESGASFWAVMREDQYGPGLGLPAELYLEGSDQHRGWFHSTLLVACALLGHAPYKRVLTHGFVLDDQGRPYSKSDIRRRQEAGEKVEYLEPNKVIAEQGAELLRLWAAYEDYRSDVRYSKEHLKQVADSYFKIRNTLRFFLGNLDGYSSAEFVPEHDRDPLDRWAAARLRQYRREVVEAYERYDFRTVFHRTVEVCATDWSAFYLDVVKDRLYCEAQQSPLRRSTRSTLMEIAQHTIAALAPMMSFTADEAWRLLPGTDGASVFLGGRIELPEASAADAELLEAGRLLGVVRDEVNAVLEPLVKAKSLGHRREACVAVSLDEVDEVRLGRVASSLEEVLAVSSVRTDRSPKRIVAIDKTTASACPRCWRHREDCAAHGGGLCTRCSAVLGSGT